MISKPRTDKSKLATTKSSSTKAKTDAAPAAAPTKRKIAKENGAQHASDEKKSDKKQTTSSNSKSSIPIDKQKQKLQTKTLKSDGKAATVQTTKKVLTVDKADPKRSTQTTEKRDPKRSSDKVKSNTEKESKSKSVSKEAAKSSQPKQVAVAQDVATLKVASKILKPPAESAAKHEIVSKIPTVKAPMKASHAISGGAKSIAEPTAPAVKAAPVPAPAVTVTTAVKVPAIAASATTVAAAAATATASILSTKNVMNQMHNVTIQSPPPMRREIVVNDGKLLEPRSVEASEQRRGRTRTRTLEAAEIVLLRPNTSSGEPTIVAQPALMPTLVNPNLANKTQIEAAPILNASIAKTMVEIKPAVSFEVMLNDQGQNDATKQPSQNSKKPKQIVDTPVADKKTHGTTNEVAVDAVNESDNYEDDFESYESDFETEGEEEEEEESDASENDEQNDMSISTGESDTDNENVISTASKHPFETGHSIENGEFDSGSFEMKVLSARSRVQRKAEVVADTGTVAASAALHSEHQHEMQNDSGIENCSNTVGIALMATHNGQLNSLDANNKTFDNISDIEIEGAAISLDPVNGANVIANPSPNRNPNANTKAMAVNKSIVPEPKPKQKSRQERRGEELLSKITLDVMNYVLFDFKPIPYELFMKIYGNSNTAQVAVQTHNDHIDQECQCDRIATQTVWSQFPIAYYSEHMTRSDFDDYKNGYGTVAAAVDADLQNNGDDENLNRTCENSLSLIHKMAIQTNAATDKSRGDDAIENIGKLNIDYGRLNRFLLESEMTLARILNIHNVKKRFRNLNESPLPISSGYLTLKPSFAAAVANQKIERTFAIDSLPGFLFTLHSENESNLNILALWHLSKLNEPVCLLSVWSKILCVEIHPKIRDIVFAGLDDG